MYLSQHSRIRMDIEDLCTETSDPNSCQFHVQQLAKFGRGANQILERVRSTIVVSIGLAVSTNAFF